VLHDGKPVYVGGKKLYEVKYDHNLLLRLLAARDREKYGETKVVESISKTGTGTFRT